MEDCFIFTKDLKLFTISFIIWIILVIPPINNALHIDSFFTDLMYEIKYLLQQNDSNNNKINNEIVIIDIDDEALWLLDRRDYMADLINAISGPNKAEVIGLDIVYDSLKNPDPLKPDEKNIPLDCPYNPQKHPYEMKLACTLNSDKVGNVVLAVASIKDKVGKKIIIYPIKCLKDAAWGLGSVHAPIDKADNNLKKALLFIDTKDNKIPIRSFGLAIASYIKNFSFNNGKIFLDQNEIKVHNSDSIGKYVIPQYLGPSNMFKYVQASDLMNKLKDENYLKNTFKNKIVLIGSTSLLLHDVKESPYTIYNNNTFFKGLMPGVEYQANVIYSLLHNKFYHPSPFWLNLLWAGVFIFLCIILQNHIKNRFSTFLPFIAIIGSFILAFILFNNYSLIIPSGNTMLAMLVTIPITFAYKFITVDRLFGKYVSPDVADLIWRNRDKLVLNGEKRIATVVFTDIRGFTTLSETADPSMILKLLNEYFEAMAKIIYENQGNLNKFIGDGLMILYGAPLSAGDATRDAINAVKSSIQMMEEVKKLNEKWKKEYDNMNINIGAGIHTGEIIVGNIGCSKRLEYSALGDTVNLSARLEGVNKEFNTNIIISEDTYNFVKDSFKLKYLGNVRVKGRLHEVGIYTIDNPMEE